MSRLGVRLLVLACALHMGCVQDLRADEPGLSDTHWAFRPIRRPEPPTVGDESWVRNPIDRFVLSALEQRGASPAPAADPIALFRRIHLTLKGLPPSIDEQEEFEARPNALVLDEWVDRLLDRSSYGERWASHWLDVVRYADSNGYERDSDKPFAWRYRDYVIRSLNQDKPMNRFAMEQLAGDLMPDSSAETHVGLGFFLVGPWDDEPANRLQARYDELDDWVSTTSQVFLGLDLGCARCHDHKSDPVTQRDYYALAAVFSNVHRPVGSHSQETMLHVGAPDRLDSMHALEDQIADAQNRLDDLKADFRDRFVLDRPNLVPEDVLEVFRLNRAERSDDQNLLISRYAQRLDRQAEGSRPPELARAIAQLEQQIASLGRQRPDLPVAYVPRIGSSNPPVMNVLLRGEIDRPGEPVTAALPAVFSSLTAAASTEPTTRLDLARWITHPDHPLFARVLVNRVWQHHFGVGLVTTGNDFGLSGEPPTHPELLDWLASWFIHDADYSLKQLHRLILTSNTYRMSQQPAETRDRADTQAVAWSRFPRQRLDAEVIRDSMLAASGQLNPRMFGPPMYPWLPDEIKASHEHALRTWQRFDEREASRRAVYAVVKRSLAPPIFEMLDRCPSSRSIARRPVTNAAPQALVCLNDEFVTRQARHLADRLNRLAPGDFDRQLDWAFRLTLGRRPTGVEAWTIRSYFSDEWADRQSAGDGDREESRRESLAQVCRLILNLNEFYYPD